MVDRKGKPRIRLVNLRGPDSGKTDATDQTRKEIVGISLGYRVLISEQAEVWTVAGLLADGTVAKEEIGELAFALMPGEHEPATAITGFLAPAPPYVMSIPKENLWQELRSIVTQLGYDQDGFYVSVGVGGERNYFEDYRQET